jgi:hypothetical protein
MNTETACAQLACGFRRGLLRRDVLVEAEEVRGVDTATLYRVYLGRAGLAGAMRTQQLTMTGPRALQRGFGRWFAWSAFASASRLAEQRRTAASRLGTVDSVRIAE